MPVNIYFLRYTDSKIFMNVGSFENQFPEFENIHQCLEGWRYINLAVIDTTNIGHHPLVDHKLADLQADDATAGSWKLHSYWQVSDRCNNITLEMFVCTVIWGDASWDLAPLYTSRIPMLCSAIFCNDWHRFPHYGYSYYRNNLHPRNSHIILLYYDANDIKTFQTRQWHIDMTLARKSCLVWLWS